MGSINIGINMEFVRSADLSFERGLEAAADLGYEYVEPMVHLGRELLSEAGYFHSFSMDNDALEMQELLDKYKLRASGLSAHTPLMKPEISVPYLRRAIRFGSEIGVRIINTDEGPKPDWMNDTQAFDIMTYSLTLASQTAERYGAVIGIEPHQIYSKTTEGLIRISNLVDSPVMKINYDMGNAYLGGADPYEGLEAVKHRVVHIHAKDISFRQSEEERGKVTGTPVGCACGEGVIDWERTVAILKSAGFEGVLSVECGTIDQAERSLAYLKKLV